MLLCECGVCFFLIFFGMVWKGVSQQFIFLFTVYLSVKGLVAVYTYVMDEMGKIMLLIGIALLVVGLLAFNSFGSVLSAGSFFFGILFIVFGMLVQLGFFPRDLRSLSGVGTILICLSIVFITFSIVVAEFVEMDLVRIVPSIFKGAIIGYRALMESERPYLWLSTLFMQFGLATLIIGIVLRIFNALRS